MGISILPIAATIVGSQTLGGELRNSFSTPDSDAQRAGDLLEERFPARMGDSATVVFRAEDGLGAADAKAAVAAALKAAAGSPHIVGTDDPFTGESGQISEDGTVAYADVQFDRQGLTLPARTIDVFKEDVRGAVAGTPVQVAFTGNAVQEPPEQGASVALGRLAAVIVLLIAVDTKGDPAAADKVQQAVAAADGVAVIARVIVAAAIIMSAVFLAFLTGVDRTIEEFGLALGLASRSTRSSCASRSCPP
ncbi:MAG: hypothetical protein FJW81_07040 [Actinobacteria bacterium]|nr:hypothetical protein [Actinomycetota bacterium]